MLGNGDDYFSTPQTFAVGNDPVICSPLTSTATSALDLAVVNDQDATVSILLGNGDGTFQAQTTASHWRRIRASIVTWRLQFRWAHRSRHRQHLRLRFRVCYGKGDGTFTAKPDFSVGSHPIGIG